MYTHKKWAGKIELTCYILNLNHIFDNLNNKNDSDTNKPDTPLSFYNLIQRLTLKLFTFLNTRILTSYSLKLCISNTESPC